MSISTSFVSNRSRDGRGRSPVGIGDGAVAGEEGVDGAAPGAGTIGTGADETIITGTGAEPVAGLAIGASEEGDAGAEGSVVSGDEGEVGSLVGLGGLRGRLSGEYGHAG